MVSAYLWNDHHMKTIQSSSSKSLEKHRWELEDLGEVSEDIPYFIDGWFGNSNKVNHSSKSSCNIGIVLSYL